MIELKALNKIANYGTALLCGLMLLGILTCAVHRDEIERESRPEENIECVTFQGHRSICKLTYKDVELCYLGASHQAFYVSCDQYEKVKSYE